MQKTVLKQMYPAKPMPTLPVTDERPRRALTERDCWVRLVACFLGAVCLGLLLWDDYRHGRKSQAPTTTGLWIYLCLRWAKEAWDNLAKLRRGETVTIAVQSPRLDWGILLCVGTFIAILVSGLAIVHAVDFRAQGRWKWELAGLCLAWPVLIWGWKRLAKNS